MSQKPKRPRDPNQLAKLIVDIATGEAEDVNPDAGKNRAAVELGRKGGQKGGEGPCREALPRQAPRDSPQGR